MQGLDRPAVVELARQIEEVEAISDLRGEQFENLPSDICDIRNWALQGVLDTLRWMKKHEGHIKAMVRSDPR